MQKIKAGIIGGAGYTGGELIRILLRHPGVELIAVQSRSNAGNPLSKVHTDLVGDTGLTFEAEPDLASADVLFLCMGHGESRSLLVKEGLPGHARIIDLSQDYRLDDEEVPGAFIYGLPEAFRDRIRNARHVANPGCFATAIQLGLLPLAQAGLIAGEVHINATTGSTGAGQSLSQTSHFSYRNNNLSVYKAFSHQHLLEIRKNLSRWQPGFNAGLNFIPMRGAFTRGILAVMYLNSGLTQSDARLLYEQCYRGHPFTLLSDENIDLKQVVNTNKCLLHIEKHDNKLMIVSAIDNLLKGASGQAVQNMNLLFGLEEGAGLNLKASYF
jgi:N-acetyl-gamma-glutamyl-phosphate reductase